MAISDYFKGNNLLSKWIATLLFLSLIVMIARKAEFLGTKVYSLLYFS
jgi:hypothetical protein